MFPSSQPHHPRTGAAVPARAVGARERRNRLARLAPFLALLPLAAFGLGLVVVVQADLTAHREANLRGTASAMAVALNLELRAGLRALEALAGSEHLETLDLDGFRNEAQRLLAREPNWFTIALTDGERQLLNLRYPPEALLPPIQDLAAVGIVLRTGHPAPGGLFEGRVSFRVPVRVDGAVRYALVATQEATTFSQLLNGPGIPRGWSALLLDGAGRLIARGAGEAAAPEALRQAVTQAGTIVGREGTLALALPVGDSRWSLVLASPPSDFLSSAWIWLAAALGAAALIAGIGIALRMAGSQHGEEARRLRGQEEAMARVRARAARRTAIIGTISEELRGPLSGLIACSDQLVPLQIPAEARVWVDRQREAAQAMLAVVDDVLDLARLERGGLVLEETDIEIAALLEDCAALARPGAEAKGLALQLAIDPGLPRWIRGDPARLRQVVGKLLEHAIHAGSAGAGPARILLAARLTPRPDMIELTVIDAGPALGEAGLVHVFDGFGGAEDEAGEPMRLRSLGLAICRTLVVAMGGSIQAEPVPGQGNRFRVAVPFRPGAAPLPARGGGALRILVAEDVPASRMLLKSVLERAGHQVTEVADGPAALAALHGATFDMAVLDLHMPSLGGLGVAQVVRSLPGDRGRVPLIALTADPAEQMQADCLAAGFDAMLRKPYETRRLLGLIDSLRHRVRHIAAPAPRAGHPRLLDQGETT